MSQIERDEMAVERLVPENEQAWEQVVTGSSNGHIMARCGYFRYHADRFEDHSLLFRWGNRPRPYRWPTAWEIPSGPIRACRSAD